MLTPEVASLPVTMYLDNLCADAQLIPDWQSVYPDFDKACRPPTAADELELYQQISEQGFDPATMIRNSVRILLQLFLRWLPRHRQNDPFVAANLLVVLGFHYLVLRRHAVPPFRSPMDCHRSTRMVLPGIHCRAT